MQLDNKYIRYYICGYLNTFISDSSFLYDPTKESYKQYRIKALLRYVGLKEFRHDVSWLAPFLSVLELVFASILVLIRSVFVIVKRAFTPRASVREKHLFACFGLASFRVKGLLESARPMEISTIKIPFIKNEYHENETDLLSVVSFSDIARSLIASWRTICFLFKKTGA